MVTFFFRGLSGITVSYVNIRTLLYKVVELHSKVLFILRYIQMRYLFYENYLFKKLSSQINYVILQ